MTTSTLRPHLVADCCPLPDGATLLTTYRAHGPESERAAALMAALITAIATKSGYPERIERSDSDHGIRLVYRFNGAGFGLLIAPDRYQFDSQSLMIRADADRTDIWRKPRIDPESVPYQYAALHAAERGHVAQERLAGPGGMVHDRFWSPDAEDPPEMSELIDIGSCLRGIDVANTR